MTERTTRRPIALPPLTRRGFLGGLGATSLAAFAADIAQAPPSWSTSEGTVLPLVAPLPAGQPDRSLFDPRSQVFAAYVMILAPLANSVRDEGPDVGWMEDGWQRMPNVPYNARIMEHVATLSWFYSHERDWNPYYRDANLLGRLDAAIGHYLSLQQDDGSYPEYDPDERGLAPTGFGTVAQSATLRDLRSVGALPGRRAEIEAAVRASSAWLVDLDRPHWNTPIQFVNQLIAGLSGVAEAADVLDDPQISASLTDRMARVLKHGQAPAGFFHEPLTPDADYNFTVMLPDVGAIYQQTHDPSAAELARRFARWWSYVTVMEPGQTEGFVLAATSGRNRQSTFVTTPEDDLDRSALGRALLEEAPGLGAFYATAQEKQLARATWATDPEPVQPRQKQDSSARLYMHVPIAPDGISTEERDRQIAKLPYLRETEFTELRLGTLDQQYAFVRRPSCYTGAAYGVRPYAPQRMGTNSFWHPAAGMLVLSLNSSGPDDWTTIADDVGTASSRSAVIATHHAGPDTTGAVIADRDLTGFAGVFTTRYTTEDDAITTEVSYWQDGLRRTISAAGVSRERIPLIIAEDDDVVFSDGTPATYDAETTAVATGLSLTRGSTRFVVHWGEPRQATYAPLDRSYLDGRRTHRTLTIAFTDDLTTELTAIDTTGLDDLPVAFATTSHIVERDGVGHVGLHAINLDNQPVDIRIATNVGSAVFRGLTPGASGYEVLRCHRKRRLSGLAVATTRGSGRTRVARRRIGG